MKKIRIKNKLKEKLGRNPKESEEINAEKDPIIIMELLMEDVEDLQQRVKDLER